MQSEPVSPAAPAGASSGQSAPAEASDRWRARFSKARQQSSRFFAGLLHRSDRHRDQQEGEDGDDEEQREEDEQPRVTFDPFHTAPRQHAASSSPSSRASFLSHLPPIEEQLHRLQSARGRPSAASHPLPLPSFFVLVDATGARGRRLLRWLSAAVESASSASSPSPFSGVLAITSSRDVQSAFNGLVALYRRHHSATAVSTAAPLRLAVAGPDSLLSRLLPAYIATLTTWPSLPLRVYPIPLYSAAPASSPCSSRVCSYLASADHSYLSLFFSSAYQHAFDGDSVEAEGAVVLDAIARYVMDAAVTVKLPLGEVSIESAAAAAHSQHSGGREEKEWAHPHPPLLSSASSAIPRPHPAPVQVPPAAELVFAPGIVSPSVQLHAVSAPVQSVNDQAAELDNDDALSVTPPHRAMPAAATAAAAGERAEAASDREMRAPQRVTLPFVADVAFLSSTRSRPRTTSDSELHKPPLYLHYSHATVRAAEEQHTIAAHPPEEAHPPQQQHHPADWDSERKGGEHKKSGSVLSSFNKALLSITRTSSAADGGRHARNATSVQLPPASTLLGSNSDSGRTVRFHKRRNSDSQTHYRGESSSHAAATQTAVASAAASALPAALRHAPLLNRRIALSWFTSGKEKGRRGSVDVGSGVGMGGGKMKRANVKGTFERVLVQRIVDDGSGLQAEKKAHKRSFMEQAMHSITHPSITSPSPASSMSSSSALAVAASDHAASAASSSSASSSALHPASALPATPALSANQLLLLARRRPPKDSSLLHRLRDDSSHTCKTVSKVIVSAPDPASFAFAGSSASSVAASASSHAQTAGALSGSRIGSGVGGAADLACLVDGVEVVGVSVASVSALVSGRVKWLAVQLFSAPSSAQS